jgi:hypothetical protein
MREGLPKKPVDGFENSDQEMRYLQARQRWRAEWQGQRIPYTKPGRKLGEQATKYDFGSLAAGDVRTYEDTNKNRVRVAFSSWRKNYKQPDAKIEIVEIDDSTILVSRVA